MKALKDTTVLDTKLTQSSKEDILKYVSEHLETSSEKLAIFTPNPEIVMYANGHEDFRDNLNRAQICLPDGVGLVMAARLLGKGSLERISGVDFMEELCKESVRKGVNTGFLGGRGSVALQTAKCLQKKYPGLKVSFVGEEWDTGIWIPEDEQKNLEFYEKRSNVTQEALMPRIHLSAKPTIDILFVAFGFPKQEEWISSHSHLPFRVGMGVGGAFDYISGNVSRAPKVLRTLGLEWMYRLARQPWRAKRQKALIHFLRLVLKERISQAY